MENINARIGVYALIAPVFLLQILSIIGCISSSPGVPNIFLLEVRLNSMESNAVRVGYLGICAHIQGQMNCVPSTTANAPNLQRALNLDDEYAEILTFALTLQRKIFLSLPAISGLFFLLGVTTFALVKWYEKKTTSGSKGSLRQGELRDYSIALLSIALAFALSSSIALAQAIPAMKAFSRISGPGPSALTFGAGTGIQVLQWLILGLLTLFTAGVWMMFHGFGGSGKAKRPVTAPAVKGGAAVARAARPPGRTAAVGPPRPTATKGGSQEDDF